MFCAPNRIFESRTAFETSLRAVNGGQTTTSTSFWFANSSFRPRTRSSDSATVLFIFQLPAITNFRSLFIFAAYRLRLTCNKILFLLVRKRCHSRQHLALEE